VRRLGIGFALVFVGCASTTSPTLESTATYEQALAASRGQPPEDVRKYTDLRQVQRQLFPRGCEYDGVDYHILLRLGTGGSVDQVIGREENEKTKCVRKAFGGVRFPPPPYAPFYLETCRGKCP
jgi:hypothetical protein